MAKSHDTLDAKVVKKVESLLANLVNGDDRLQTKNVLNQIDL